MDSGMRVTDGRKAFEKKKRYRYNVPRKA